MLNDSVRVTGCLLIYSLRVSCLDLLFNSANNLVKEG
jgi:hypothetical protein